MKKTKPFFPFLHMDRKGLQFKIWRYFVVFAGILLVLLWLLQIVFLRTYYQYMKTLQVQKIGDTIAAAYGTSTFSDTVYKYTFNNGLFVQIVDENGTMHNEWRKSNADEAMRPAMLDPIALDTLLFHLSQSTTGKVSYISSDMNPRAGGKTLTYGAVLKQSSTEKLYLYINAQIAPVDSTSTVLQTQLFIITILALLLSLGISLIISNKLTRPIIRITQTAEKLADGDFEVTFPSGNYSEINRLVSTMNDMTRELSKTEQLRRDLIANVSHDLRTPLTMVKMYAELIRDVSGNLPEKRNAHAQVIIDEADRLSLLITDMLDLSKIQAGTESLHLSSFDLGEKTRVILDRFHVLTERHNFQFSLNCAGNTTVTADERKIEQVLYNLVGNAVNYTGEDKKVSLWVCQQHDGVYFSVTDTGKGISPEKCARIWERYYMEKGAKHHQVVGTGLGLSIVKGILEAHHARFGVDSTVGRGSTFWFLL